jgi:hypothetical protein
MIKGAKTAPRKKTRRSRRRHRGKHKCCSNKFHCMRIKVIPIGGSPGVKSLRQLQQDSESFGKGHIHDRAPKQSVYNKANTSTYLLAKLMSSSAPLVVTRRWSSVEVGAHQLNLPLSPSSRAATRDEKPPSDVEALHLLVVRLITISLELYERD